MSIEQVASLSSQNALPIPSLNLDALAPSTSTFTSPAPPAVRSVPVARAYSSEDPWSAAARYASSPGGMAGGAGSVTNGAPSSISGTGLPPEWWRRQARAEVRLLGPQGFILNRYMVYEVSSDVRLFVSSAYELH